jgi:uncharacterized protein (TIGR02594 family)
MTNTAYKLAQADIGTVEWSEGHNPKVVKYFSDVGHDWVKDDETAWCAAFVGAMLKRAGLPHTGKLSARSYLQWGEEVALGSAQEGDIVVFWRGSPDGWQGHVGFFVRRAGTHIEVLGGNQNNSVNVQRYPADRLLGVRRDPSTQPPTGVYVAEAAPRQSVAQSKTVQASVAQIAASVAGGITAAASLSGTAQLALIGAAAVVGVTALIILRERLLKWSWGVR